MRLFWRPFALALLLFQTVRRTATVTLRRKLFGPWRELAFRSTAPTRLELLKLQLIQTALPPFGLRGVSTVILAFGSGHLKNNSCRTRTCRRNPSRGLEPQIPHLWEQRLSVVMAHSLSACTIVEPARITTEW